MTEECLTTIGPAVNLAAVERQQVADELSSRAARRAAAAGKNRTFTASSVTAASLALRAYDKSTGVSSMFARRTSLAHARAASAGIAFGEGVGAATDQPVLKPPQDPDEMWAAFLTRQPTRESSEDRAGSKFE